MQERFKPVTINDIAAVLGVAPSTVSRALQGHPDIKASTVEKVKKVAEKLNYQPNIIASNLRKSHSNTIGIIVPKIANYFYSSAIEGIEDLAYGLGYKVVISQSMESFDREIANAKAMLFGRVDGVLASISRESFTFDHFQSLLDRNVPIVFFNRIPDKINASKVYSDDYKGAVMATEHLIKTGCTKLFHLKGPQHLSLSQNRYNGFMKALNDHNQPVNKNNIIDTGSEIADGYRVMSNMLAQKNMPDGILAFNDRIAVGAMKAMKEQGIKIPVDISIIGFSNTPESQIIEPSLTTVEQSGFDVGKRAFDILLGQIKDKTMRIETDVIDTKLIVRDSTHRI